MRSPKTRRRDPKPKGGGEGHPKGCDHPQTCSKKINNKKQTSNPRTHFQARFSLCFEVCLIFPRSFLGSLLGLAIRVGMGYMHCLESEDRFGRLTPAMISLPSRPFGLRMRAGSSVCKRITGKRSRKPTPCGGVSDTCTTRHGQLMAPPFNEILVA